MTKELTNPLPTVFVIDDDVAIQRSLKALLGAMHFDAQIFSSAESFLQASVADCNACLFVDVRMPGMGGVNLLKELRRRKYSFQVILMTGNPEADFVTYALDAGAAAVLEKPFRVEKLKQLLQRMP